MSGVGAEARCVHSPLTADHDAVNTTRGRRLRLLACTAIPTVTLAGRMPEAAVTVLPCTGVDSAT